MILLTSKTNRFLKSLAGWCALLMLGVSTASAYDVVPRMAWWYDARFGMFIHFGSYSYLGHSEWAFSTENWTKANYQTQISANFDPTNFNAATIVGFAKAAGMKYLVITAKHHEGFAMWHSQVPSFTDVTGAKLYNLYDYAGFHRDVLMELKNECDAQGIKFCLYYSILDWNHPSQNIANFSGTTFSAMTSLNARTNYINDMKAQLGELITNYNPAVLWFDGDWWPYTDGPATVTNWWNKADGIALYNYLIALKPDIIINERVKRGYELGDFDCPEQTVPAAPLARTWETCATMNGAWGYNAGLENSYRSATIILHEMVQVMSRDGNYLLNIGPKGDGTMTPGSTNILGAFATWMNSYSDSVHGTTASPYSAEPMWGYYTKKSGRLYAHVFNWPVGGLLQISLLTNAINRVYLLNDTNTSLSYTVSGGNINISVPVSAPNAMDSVVVVDVSGVPAAAAAPPVLPGPITLPLVNPSFETNTSGSVISTKTTAGFDVAGNDLAGWRNAGSTYVNSGVDFTNDAGNATHNGRVIVFCDQGDSGAYQIVNYQMQAGDVITLIWWAKSTYGHASQNVKLLSGASLASTYASLTQLANSTAALNDVGNGGPFSQYALNYTATPTDAGKYVAVSFLSPGTAGAWATFDDFSLTLATAPPPITVAVGGGQIQLYWPGHYTGWQLQMQTNAPGGGLGANWITISGSGLTNQFTLSVDAANGSVFLRLVSPSP